MTSAWIRRAVSPGDLLEAGKTLAYERGSESVICDRSGYRAANVSEWMSAVFSKAGKLRITNIDSKLFGVTNDSLVRVA